MKLRKTAILLLCFAILAGCSLPGLGLEPAPSPGQTPEPDGTAGKSTGENNSNNRFTLAHVSDYGINPLVTTSTMNLLFTPLVYETLFVLDEHFEPSPGLVTDWRSDDGIYWYFTVDTSIQFHDGSYLTAADAAYSVQRAQRSTRYKNRLSIIYGVQALDDNEFVISLTHVNMLFPALLDIPVIKYDSIGESAPAGTGPYKLSGDSKRLELFRSHRKASEMPIDTIFLREFVSVEDSISAFEGSELSLVVNDPSGSSNLGYGGDNEVRYLNTTSMHFIGFNSESQFFMDPTSRAMIGFAIDRERIVTDALGGAGTAATLPVSPASYMYNASFAATLGYSPEKFGNCLSTAKILDYDEDGKLEYMETGIPMEIDLTFIVNNETAAKVAAARQIANALRDAGITVTLRELEWDEYIATLQSGKFDMYYGETILTADFDISRLIAEGGSLNYGKFKDPAYASLAENYLSSPEDIRLQAFELMLSYVANTAPILPVAFEKRQVITHRNIIKDLLPTDADVFYSFKDWTIDLGE